MQGQIHISSPRAPRSSHHRSASTRSSPRQRERRSFGGHRPNQPNFEGSPHAALVPENLEDDRDTFNVDPTSGTLEAGGETYQPPIGPAGRRGLFGGLRKAWQRNRAPGPEIAQPEPAVVHEEETLYAPVPRAEPEMQYSSPVPNTPYTAPLSDGGRIATPEVHYAAFVPHTSVAGDAEYPESAEREPHHRQESSSSVSETVHATTQEHYEGTTVVNHDMVLSEQIGSPQFVEPKPASDYAKMDSPAPSEASFGFYVTRLQNFFQALNNLPWIASDRVTVDYIPGRARQGQGGPTLRSRPARKAVISWYNSNVPQGSIDLLSSGSPSSRLAEFPQAKGMATPSAQYADVVYANNLPAPASSAGPPPMSSTTQDMASQPAPNRPRRVPAPQVTADLAAAGEADPFYSPRYPNGGYVPYDQLPPQQVAAYTGSSVASSLPPHQHQASEVP